MTTRNAQIEQCTWRESLIPSPMVSSHSFQSHLLHTPINEKRDAILGRRTSATLQDNSRWDYIYNQRSEITSAIRKNASNVTQNTMRYVFDNIGNRTSSYEDATSKTYDANSLNQYTEIDVTGGSTVCPLYDDDGNMTQYGDWTYTYDAENRLVGALNGNTRLEYIYDALGRRVAKKLYQYNSLSRHERYVYDGMKLLATYNAKSSFAKINSFLWQPFGLDVPLIMTYNSTVYGYLVDANKNVLGLFNPSKTRVATYLYGPFGQKLSESGTIAANNPLQFSSEQFDADLSLVYYNFRYYFPAIGKWLTKDPIGEEGGWNLYAFCGNDAVNMWDRWGLSPQKIEKDIIVSKISDWAMIEARLVTDNPLYAGGLESMVEVLKENLKDNSCYSRITIWGHGGNEGQVAVGMNEYIEVQGIKSKYLTLTNPIIEGKKYLQDRAKVDFQKYIRELVQYMCECYTIEFVQCSSGEGNRGDLLGQHLVDALYSAGKHKHIPIVVLYRDEINPLVHYLFRPYLFKTFYPKDILDDEFNLLPKLNQIGIKRKKQSK